MVKEEWHFFKKHKRPIIIVSTVLLAIGIAILLWKLIPEEFQDCRECFQQYEPFQQFNVNGQDYKVHEDLENPQLAAETMDSLNKTANQLIDYLHSEYMKGDRINMIKPDKQKTVLYGIKSLKKNYKTANLEENIPERSGGDTSYVIDKGEIFAMCIRDPKNQNKIDPKMNDLTFVLIHEMAHLFTKTFGHDRLFWENFRFLLKEAKNIGVYETTDYKKNKSPYCGILISYSPIYDSALTEYFISS
jgi:hypothetical protein